MRIVVGTRGSPLALVQTEQVLSVLRQHKPDIEFTVKQVHSQGDIETEVPLADMPRGVFATELENALERLEIDMAVHSFKDLPTDLASDFTIAAIGPREDPRDVLITRSGVCLDDLLSGARLGTSSPRRLAQLKAHKPDLKVVPIRGNVGTRIRKVREGVCDGVVLAAAGVRRLGLGDQVTEYLAPDVCLPAAGQGSLAIEVRARDHQLIQLAALVEDRDARIALTAETEVIRTLGGGCKAPIAVFAELNREGLRVRGVVGSVDGNQLLKAEVRGDRWEAIDIGRNLAHKLLDMGAGPLMEPMS